MKLKFPLIAAFVALLSLTACGGGGSGSSSGSTTPAAESPAQLSFTDTAVGTGATIAAGKTLNVNYTGWVYSSTATGNKGSQFQTGNFSFVFAAGQVIPGFDQGMVGMKVGGKRTIVIPASLGYGANPPAGSGIPANSGLVFDVEVVSMQ